MASVPEPQTIPVPRGVAEEWVAARERLLVAILASAGLAVRLVTAAGTWLNPDEVLNWIAVREPGLASVFRGLDQSPHPPLYYIFLWCWRLIGDGDFMLRLPSALAGTLLAVVAYHWLRPLFGRATAFAGLVVAGFAPELVALSAEVRPNIVQTLLVALGLLLVEQGIGRRSGLRALLSGIVLALAFLADYSTLVLLPALVLYAALRLAQERPPRTVAFGYAGGLSALLAAAAVSYAVHIRHIRDGAIATEAKAGWLSHSFYTPGHDNVLFFAGRQTYAVFRYLFSSPVAGPLALLLFALGLVLLLARAEPGEARARRASFALVATGVLTALVLAVARVFPFGGTRHVLYLSPLVLLPVCVAAGFIARGRAGTVLLAAVVLVPAWLGFKSYLPRYQHLKRADQQSRQMSAAMDHCRRLAGQGGLVVCDKQTQTMLLRYLLSNRAVRRERNGYREDADSNLTVVTLPAGWLMDADGFARAFRKFGRDYGLGSGTPVCVVAAGWGYNLAVELHDISRLSYPGKRLFGANISAFSVPVGSEPHSPEARQALVEVARGVQPELPAAPVIALWPTDQYAESIPLDARVHPVNFVPYRKAYNALQNDPREFAMGLPALAFWQFGTAEEHPAFMRYMDDAEHYTAGGCRFTLLRVDSTRRAAAYLVELLSTQAGLTDAGAVRQ